jgi:hypothetical protein
MSIVYPIPHTARFIQTENIFSANFNVPTLNKYDFGIAGNLNQNCFEYQKNTVFLIERISIGGNVSEEIFNDSIHVTPLLTFKNRQSGYVIYQLPFKISSFYRSVDISTFTSSDISNDFVTLTMTGLLNQVPATIGKATIKLVVSLSIFAIDNNVYNQMIRSGIKDSFSEKIRA